MIAAFVLSLTMSPSLLGDGFVQFSRSSALRRDRVEVSIGAFRTDRIGGETVYWARRNASGEEGGAHQWADSRTCPAIREALAALHDLPPPQIDIPGMSVEPGVIVMDGVGYRLTASALYEPHTANLTYSSNIGTPLAEWVETTLTRLNSCWSATVPNRGTAG